MEWQSPLPVLIAIHPHCQVVMLIEHLEDASITIRQSLTQLPYKPLRFLKHTSKMPFHFDIIYIIL
jgi:hypothetical protein